jgi:FkbM family methyltransferase
MDFDSNLSPIAGLEIRRENAAVQRGRSIMERGRDGAAADPPLPEEMRRGRRRLGRYVGALGRLRGGALFVREMLGDRSTVRVRCRGHKLSLRLRTSDILVLYSVFVAEDYGGELPEPPKTIIDAGAYVGYSTVFLAARYPGVRILAVEPDQSNFALLVRNVPPDANVVPLNRALWHRSGRLQLRDRGTGHWAFSVVGRTAEGRGEASVEAVTVAQLAEQFSLERIDLLKLDVEGAEKEIFEGCGDWLGRVGTIFAELHDRINPGCTQAFERATASFRRVSTKGMTVTAIR